MEIEETLHHVELVRIPTTMARVNYTVSRTLRKWLTALWCTPELQMKEELMESITQALSHLEVEFWAWTDSEIVLQWLSAHPRKWKTYVANRTLAILQMLPRPRCNHVLSESNPADCASRGLAPGELVTHPLWRKGPEWLSLEADYWQKIAVQEMDKDDLMGVRKLNVLQATAMHGRIQYEIEKQLLERRSRFTLILLILPYVNRMHMVLKKFRIDADLTPVRR